ncbi:MAG: NAD(P)-binding protein [bacterium]|nr:NAD(P)-binding protein [bacterium]
MSRLKISTKDQAQSTMDSMYKDLERRIIAAPPGLCPVDVTRSFIRMCLAQSCGKCVPCRAGLRQLAYLFDDILHGDATEETVEVIRKTAKGIYYSADCAIGYEAAKLVLKCLDGCMDDIMSHIEKGYCVYNSDEPVACVRNCPAKVDIPGYIALVGEGRYADAIRLIRKDNPMPSTCAYICEHPCEHQCKRKMVDAPLNIRGLKKMAVDHAGDVPVPECGPATGKKVAIVGGGPSGLTAAYYLSLMGHKVTVFEQRKQLGGMLRYGIPNYRLPRKILDAEIASILSTGIEVKKEVSVGKDISMKELVEGYDATYIAIGAHTDKKLGIEGEDAKGVVSAVEMLRAIGDDELPDYTGKRVVVIGGGNVAMDCARSSVRLGAESVDIVYRRRKADMTALKEEVEGAEAEGCNVLELISPVKIEKDEEGKVKGLWVQPQMISSVKRGRPAPKNANKEMEFIPCEMVQVAIGQDIESDYFAELGIPTKWGQLMSDTTCQFEGIQGVFAGGDCATGPATVIKAIAAGKVAAANIDKYLGFNHLISCDVEVPPVDVREIVPCGRVEVAERHASDRKKDLDPIEYGFSCEEACQEAGRCLRCDKIGFGSLRGGRVHKW